MGGIEPKSLCGRNSARAPLPPITDRPPLLCKIIVLNVIFLLLKVTSFIFVADVEPGFSNRITFIGTLQYIKPHYSNTFI